MVERVVVGECDRRLCAWKSVSHHRLMSFTWLGVLSSHLPVKHSSEKGRTVHCFVGTTPCTAYTQ